jgi:hypothetical protein
MMKTHETMKEMEIKALDAVSALLGKVPSLDITSVEHETAIGRDKDFDAVINLENDGRATAIVIEVKNKGQPRYVRSAIYQLRNYTAHMSPSLISPNAEQVVPMLVTPYLSPEARALCDEFNVCYLDLYGNARLVFGNVFIERSVADKPKSETRSLRSIFSPKAAAILRLMLRNPNEAWRVTELAERADASLGHVSNVRKALLEREWIEEHHEGVVLTKPRELIETWRNNYRRPSGHRKTGYTHLHGKQLDHHLSGFLGNQDYNPRAICSLHSAAKWISPFGRDGMNTFYTDEEGAEYLADRLDLSPTSKGANVAINIIRDDSIFADAIEPVPGIYCTSPIQTYLDLWVGNDRDREAAQFLQEEHLPWLS